MVARSGSGGVGAGRRGGGMILTVGGLQAAAEPSQVERPGQSRTGQARRRGSRLTSTH